MKRRLVVLAVLIVMIAGFVGWRMMSKKPENSETEITETAVAEQPEKSDQPESAESGETVISGKDSNSVQTGDATVLENEGNLEIIIPDDQESEGQ